MNPFKRLSKDEVQSLSIKSLLWCFQRWPEKRKYKVVDLSIQRWDKNKEDERLYGKFNSINGIITIYYNIARTPKNVISTVLHEFCHTNHPSNWYTRYLNERGYENHPYEAEAYQFERDHWKECFNELYSK